MIDEEGAKELEGKFPDFVDDIRRLSAKLWVWGLEIYRSAIRGDRADMYVKHIFCNM